jgi:hypothetical protein
MTTPSPQQPHRAPESARYNPITASQLNRPASSALTRPIGSFFSGPLGQPVSDQLAGRIAGCFALPLLALPFFNSLDMSFVPPLLILVLLGCLIARMEGPVRQVAAVPLVLSALRLSGAMATYIKEDRLLGHAGQGAAFDPGFLWLPTFFLACLAFIRNKETATFKVIFIGSCILVAAGLLPGQAFIGIFYMLDVMLFFGIVVAIFFDLSAYSQRQPNRTSAAAH